jgi:(p)ppGpp synthase/HD superfamily hydrolase
VRDQVHLEQIMAKVKKVKEVYSVRRYVYGSHNH